MTTTKPEELPARWGAEAERLLQLQVTEERTTTANRYRGGKDAHLKCASELAASLAAHPVNTNLSEIDTSLVVGGWRPIEMAPKDGSEEGGNRQLLCKSARGKAEFYFWDSDQYAKKPRPFWNSYGLSMFGTRHIRANQPTHWSPLPGATDPLLSEVERLREELAEEGKSRQTLCENFHRLTQQDAAVITTLRTHITTLEAKLDGARRAFFTAAEERDTLRAFLATRSVTHNPGEEG
jgi:hypothetical protein